MGKHPLSLSHSWPTIPASAVRLSTISLVVLLSVAAAHAADVSASLADSAELQDNATVRTLLVEGADVNATQVDGMTALHWAAYHGDLPTVKLLVDNSADVNVLNRYGVPPLSVACTNGNDQIVKLLLGAGADPSVKLRGGETPLMTAARTGRIGPVEALIAAGVDVDAREDNKQTAIMWAAADGHANVVQVLIDAGAEFVKPLDSGFTPLFFAVREGHTNVVHTLLAAGVDVNEELRPQSGNRRQRSNPLIVAVENGHFETAAYLLEKGADPNGAPAGFTPLLAMTWVSRPLLGDSNPSPVGSGNLSSLDFVRLLLKSGADVDARFGQASGHAGRYSGGDAEFGNDGATALLMAARNSDLQLLKLLLEAGADWQIPNKDNCSALLAAAGVGALGSGDELPGTEAEAIQTVRLLLELGADVNAVDDHGETAMHGAAYQERPALVQFLVANGADVSTWNQINKFGWTPLMIAHGHRPGNFRPSPKTIVAVEEVMRANGVEPPPEILQSEDDERYRSP